jgi:hypothetical protein
MTSKQLFHSTSAHNIFPGETSVGLDQLQIKKFKGPFAIQTNEQKLTKAPNTKSAFALLAWPHLSPEASTESRGSLIGLIDGLDHVEKSPDQGRRTGEPKINRGPSSHQFKLSRDPVANLGTLEKSPNKVSHSRTVANHHIVSGYRPLTSMKRSSKESISNRTEAFLKSKVQEYTIKVQYRQNNPFQKSSPTLWQGGEPRYEQTAKKSGLRVAETTGASNKPTRVHSGNPYSRSIGLSGAQEQLPYGHYQQATTPPTALDLLAVEEQSGGDLLQMFYRLFGESQIMCLFEEFGAGSLDSVLQRKGIEIPKAKKHTALRTRYDMNAGFVASDKPPVSTSQKRRNSRTLNRLLM